MAALAPRLSCGDECRVIGPAGDFATSLGAVLERSLVRFGAGGWRGQWGRRARVGS